VKRRGIEDTLPPKLILISLTGTVMVEETLQVVVEEGTCIFLITGLCFDSCFTARRVIVHIRN
jgi:hypothetical protein